MQNKKNKEELNKAMNEEFEKRFKKYLLIVVLISVFIVFAIMKIFNVAMQKKMYSNLNYTKEELSKHMKEVEELKDLGERDRVRKYLSIFLKNISTKNYDVEYNKMYSVFRNNFFHKKEQFVEYVEQNIPKDALINERNFEKIGDLYILFVDLVDPTNIENSLYNMKFVYKEEALNNYIYSFSVHTVKDNGKDFEYEPGELHFERPSTSAEPTGDVLNIRKKLLEEKEIKTDSTTKENNKK